MPNGGDVASLARQTLRLPVEGLTLHLLSPQLDVRSSVVGEANLGSPERSIPNQRFDVTRLPIPRPVGARLLGFAREWNRLTTDQFVRSVVRKGYRIELDSYPNLSPVPIPMQLSRDSEKAQRLRQEIISLLDKRAIEELPVIVVAQDEWSPKPEVAQDRFYCISN